MEERFGAAVEWLPFDLHPEYPPEGIPRAQLVARYTPAGIERTASIFASHGLEYNPNPDVVPNSMRALRLTEHARASGLHQAFHDRVMDAYWAEGQDIGDPDLLRSLAADVKLDGADDVLEGDSYADDIRRATAEAHAVGINAIPAFVLDHRLLVLGAHPRETFERAFAQIDAAAKEEGPP